MRESVLQKKVLSHLKSEGIYAINIHGSSYMARGTPDIIACIDGYFVAIELKVGDNDLEPAQKIQRKRILNNGGLHLVIRNMENLEKAIETIRRWEDK